MTPAKIDKIINKITTCLLYLALIIVTSLVLVGLLLSYLEGDMSHGLFHYLT